MGDQLVLASPGDPHRHAHRCARAADARTPTRSLRAREDDGFHAVLDGFRTMAADDPQHWVVIDGGASMEEVGSSIRRSVSERLHL